jgi:hypothetical protein
MCRFMELDRKIVIRLAAVVEAKAGEMLWRQNNLSLTR